MAAVLADTFVLAGPLNVRGRIPWAYYGLAAAQLAAGDARPDYGLGLSYCRAKAFKLLSFARKRLHSIDSGDCHPRNI